MALRAGQSYTTDNGTTTVIQGALTPEQTAWWNRSGTPNYLTLTPAQDLYIALCKNGFHLKKALESCGLKEKKAAEAKQVLRTLDADSVVKQVTRLSLPAQRLYLELCLNGMHLLESFGLTDELEAQQALNILNADRTPRVNDYGVVTHITRPSFVGANLQEYDLRGADLQRANLWRAEMQRAQLQGADLRYADLQGAKMQGANLDGADLRLTDLSGVDFNHARNLENTNRNLENTKWKLAFYDATNPPENLPDNIKDKLLALDEPAYKTAKELQDAYREALVSDNEEAITAAEKQLTTYLEQYRRDNATKAIEQAVSVLGAEATFAEVARASAGSAVTITADSATKAASPSGQQGVSLGGADKPANGDVNPYQYYSIGSR